MLQKKEIKKFYNSSSSIGIIEYVQVAQATNLSDENKKKILTKRHKVDLFFEKYLDKYPVVNNFVYLILNRWIGLDAVFSVTSNQNLSFSLFKEALNEKFQRSEHSFYEQKFLDRKFEYIQTWARR